MPYPEQKRDRAPWAILRAPIRPQFARDLVFGSMDRQNALQCPTRRDLGSMAIQTRVDTAKRLISQFIPIPGLFQTIPDPAFCCIGRYPTPAPRMLHSGTAPIWTTDPAPAPRRSRPRSDPKKPLKISSLQNETLIKKPLKKLSLKTFSPENMFRSGFKIEPRGRASGRVGTRIEE